LFEIKDDIMMLQEGNDSPAYRLPAIPSQSLEDNHIGIWYENYDRYQDTEFVSKNGFKRMRIGSLAYDDQYWGTPINAQSLADEVNDKITEYHDAGVKIELVLASGAGLPAWETTFQSEEEIEQLLKLVRFVVDHFEGRIQYYEIWNEPGYVLVSDYAKLVQRVVPVIREINPDAKIVIGAIQCDMDNGFPGYGEFQRFHLDTRYLNLLLQSGVVDLVDGISWHPFYGNIPTDPYVQEYPTLVQDIKNLAESNGFVGEYFADEILWHTVDEEGWDNGPPVSQEIAAKYYTRAIAEHRGLGINVTINTFFQVPFVEPIRNIAVSLAGAEPADFPITVETDEAANVRMYTFELPGGERLAAVWTHDEAVEEDAGVRATVTLPGFSAREARGIDVFHGFEQDLTIEAADGSTVVPGVMVKDYPVLIRFR